MSNIGHFSADGVRSYKCITEILREKPSDILNTRVVKDIKETVKCLN